MCQSLMDAGGLLMAVRGFSCCCAVDRAGRGFRHLRNMPSGALPEPFSGSADFGSHLRLPGLLNSATKGTSLITLAS